MGNLNRRNESERSENAANLAEVKPLSGIVCLEILLLLFHAFEHAVELLEELLVSHTLRLLQPLLLCFFFQFEALFFLLLLACILLLVFSYLMQLDQRFINRFATVRFFLWLLVFCRGFLLFFL